MTFFLNEVKKVLGIGFQGNSPVLLECYAHALRF